jgi:hypothetical protein
MAEAVMVQRAAIAQRNADHRLLRRGRRLADRFGHFAGLAMTEPSPALAVADNHKRRETEALAALHRFGDAVDVHELFDQLLATVVVAAAAASSAPIVTPSTIAAAAIAAAPTSAAARTARATARVLGRRSFGRSLRSRGLGLRRSFGDCGLGRLGSGFVGLLVLVLHS